jgi:hypothetical protein
VDLALHFIEPFYRFIAGGKKSSACFLSKREMATLYLACQEHLLAKFGYARGTVE